MNAGAGWLANVQTASTAIWSGCGVGYRDGELWVEPTWPSGGTWWALLGLPIAGGKYLSLLWDGSTLARHTAGPQPSARLSCANAFRSIAPTNLILIPTLS